ncbi:MAG TPA: molecular chaperone [Sphingomicrobium sp.]|nr:molecular chaperone [Sphingomicrobium sp.]
MLTRLTKSLVVAAAALSPALAAFVPAHAGVGDLLVAPTRIVLDGRRGTEVILNNIGEEEATYRISVELRRMTKAGELEDVPAPNADELAAQAMILYAPRRVTLPPRQPQAIRISARAPEGLADGEYRVHLLFRAVPPPRPVTQPGDVRGVAISLTPIYGVTIPVIVRLGNLSAKAGIADVHVAKLAGKPAIAFDLSRSGDRSTFGEIRVFKAGVTEPIALQRGVAVYKEISDRTVTIPVSDKYTGALSGPVTVQYVESAEEGGRTLAETQTVLR